MADEPEVPPPGFTTTTPKGGLYSGAFDSSGLDPNTRSVVMDARWTLALNGTEPATHITFSFPTSATDYTGVEGGYPDPSLVSTFSEVTSFQKEAARTAFGLVSSYTQLTFEEVASGLAVDATFRFARYADGGSESNFPAGTGYGYNDSRSAGDTFLGGNGEPPANYFGTDHFNTIMHEMGHAFGLKHGHEPSLNGTLAPQFNDNEFSVMTYASYFGADTEGATEAWVGSAPQSYMMYDIAALQAYYGANFDRLGTTSVYTWDTISGQQYINGEVAEFTGASSTGKIFSTVWTEGATTTYDLSAFSDDQVDDMRPGYWLTFSSSQIADLNSMAAAGTPQYQAQGNIYNALLYGGDTRSMVSNLITGSGNDQITGNDLDNIITANAGSDIIAGGEGSDTVSGGAGADTVYFGSGHNVLRDLLADMNGDSVHGLGFTSTLDILDTLVGRSNIGVATDGGLSSLTIGASTVQLYGDFSAGDFMAAARGAHTEISYVNFLPTLSEGVQVDLAAINGIANQPFLTGDGSVSFTMQMETAVSSYKNMLGYYNLSVDGSISDVHLAFENTLAPSSVGHTIDLGTPDADAQIGFFLIQDGFSLYGDLPDDLFFQPGTSSPFSLYSSSLGLLSSAQVFHSFSAFNFDGAQQVLSGTALGGEGLRIGFEDLFSGIGDNDFQDVVFTVHASSDDLFVI